MPTAAGRTAGSAPARRACPRPPRRRGPVLRVPGLGATTTLARPSHRSASPLEICIAAVEHPPLGEVLATNGTYVQALFGVLDGHAGSLWCRAQVGASWPWSRLQAHLRRGQ